MSARLHHASASNTDLLLKCPWPFSPNLELTDTHDEMRNEPLRFGSAFHKCQEHVLKKEKTNIKAIAKHYNVKEEKLGEFAERGKKFLKESLPKNWEKHPFAIEKKMAYDPFQDKARFLNNEGERDYSGRRLHEIPGTADLALNYPGTIFVYDWKSGNSMYDASTGGQLKTLALGFRSLWNPATDYEAHPVHVYYVRFDETFIEPSDAILTRSGLDAHRWALMRQLQEALSPTPYLRPGIHCKYCKAVDICPAVTHDVEGALGDDLNKALDPEQVARIYERLLPAEKLVETVRRRVTEYVESNGSLPLSNGKYATLKTQSFEDISKTSIREALGKVGGEELINELREKGVFKTTERKQLRQQLDPSARK